jgi:glycosyltransferase involved in cell wall biosynthesis
MPQVLARFPQARLLLAGDGELRVSLEAETLRLGIANSVQFLGYRHDVPDLLQAADLFVMPSYMEGLGTTLIDAMFARAPIVAAAAGGIPEVVGRGSDGEEPVALMVPPRDSAGLAAAISQALADLPALRGIVDRAELRAQQRFTARQMVEGTLAVYREVLASAQPAAIAKSRARAA